MRKLLRPVVALVLPCAVLMFALVRPRLFLEEIVLPAATALWLVLRTFVLSIHQAVYWWGSIAGAVFVLIALLLRGASSRDASTAPATLSAWDPVRRWKESILLNADTEPSRDTFRRDLSWLVASLYVVPHTGRARYQVREALQEKRIAIPTQVWEFLFAPTLPRQPAPSFFADPRACLRAKLDSLARTAHALLARHRRSVDYTRSVEDVLSFIETRLETTHEHDTDA